MTGLGRSSHVLVFAVVLGGGATLFVSASCGPGPGSGGPTVGPPAVFVIDSTNTLFSFDAQGHSIGSVALPGTIDANNGGGITYAPNAVSNDYNFPFLYVTSGGASNSVSAYSLSLVPFAVPGIPFFPNLQDPRAIAYDVHDNQFYVADGHGLCAYVPYPSGILDASPFCLNGGGSARTGAAYDPDDQTIWTSSPAANNGDVYEFTESLAPFAPQPSAFGNVLATFVTVCPSAATGGATVVLTGGPNGTDPWLSDGTPLPFNNAQAFGNSTTYGASCDPSGNLYLATQSGLFLAKVSATGFQSATPSTAGVMGVGLAPGFPGLVPPIYAVLALGGGASDAGASDAGASDTGPNGGDNDAGGTTLVGPRPPGCACNLGWCANPAGSGEPWVAMATCSYVDGGGCDLACPPWLFGGTVTQDGGAVAGGAAISGQVTITGGVGVQCPDGTCGCGDPEPPYSPLCP
jgi:hypothetical protein